MDVLRKTMLLSGIMDGHPDKLSPILLNSMQGVTMDAVLYLLCRAQPSMALRGLGETLDDVTRVLRDEFERNAQVQKDNELLPLFGLFQLAGFRFLISIFLSFLVTGSDNEEHQRSCISWCS